MRGPLHGWHAHRVAGLHNPHDGPAVVEDRSSCCARTVADGWGRSRAVFHVHYPVARHEGYGVWGRLLRAERQRVPEVPDVAPSDAAAFSHCAHGHVAAEPDRAWLG